MVNMMENNNIVVKKWFWGTTLYSWLYLIDLRITGNNLSVILEGPLQEYES